MFTGTPPKRGLLLPGSFTNLLLTRNSVFLAAVHEILPIKEVTYAVYGLDSKKNPVINDDVCIRCYCCAEQCPDRAVRLQGGVLNHSIRGLRKIMKI